MDSTLAEAHVAGEMEPMLILALAAFVAGSGPVRIPSLRVDVLPIHPFVLLALALQGGMAACFVGMAGILGGAAGRRPLPAAERLAFNLVTNVAATALAAWTATRLGGQVGARAGEWIAPLAGATLAYFAVGTGLVAAAIAIERREGYLKTWNRSLRWTALPYAAGFTVAIAALTACESSFAAGVAITIAPCWCLVLVYRAHALRHAALERRTGTEPELPMETR
jgi:hypothetical protein